jgi:hypothetical protein
MFNSRFSSERAKLLSNPNQQGIKQNTQNGNGDYVCSAESMRTSARPPASKTPNRVNKWQSGTPQNPNRRGEWTGK